MVALKTHEEADRFWSKVVIDCACDCWIWIGWRKRGSVGSGGGYGLLRLGGRKNLRAHVVAYETWRGPVPPGLQLDHLCRQRACVNPAHLEAVSQRVNILRGTSPAAKHARTTHCPSGHEYAGRNLKVVQRSRSRGGQSTRYCRQCFNDQRRAWRRKKKEVPSSEA